MARQADRMTDEQLSRQLGRYQATESIGILLGVLLVVAGCVTMFIRRDPLLICALVFPGVALFLLVAKPAQKKKKALLRSSWAVFPHGADAAFGPEPEAPELPIDRTFLESAELLAVPWTECSVEDFHEGVHNGCGFPPPMWRCAARWRRNPARTMTTG